MIETVSLAEVITHNHTRTSQKNTKSHSERALWEALRAANLLLSVSPRAGASPVIAPFVLFTVHRPYSLRPLNRPNVSKCGHNSQLELLFKDQGYSLIVPSLTLPWWEMKEQSSWRKRGVQTGTRWTNSSYCTDLDLVSMEEEEMWGCNIHSWLQRINET